MKHKWCSFSSTPVLPNKNITCFVSIFVNSPAAYTYSEPNECIPNALLSDAVKIFFWFKLEMQGILGKTVPTIDDFRK